MTTIRSTRLGVLLFIPFLAGLGSTGAQAYDPRVTTRPSDLMGGRSPRVVRDHRYPGGKVPERVAQFARIVFYLPHLPSSEISSSRVLELYPSAPTRQGAQSARYDLATRQPGV